MTTTTTTRPSSSYLTNHDSERARARGAYTIAVTSPHLTNDDSERARRLYYGRHLNSPHKHEKRVREARSTAKIGERRALDTYKHREPSELAIPTTGSSSKIGNFSRAREASI
jgi:hypothetical protein